AEQEAERAREEAEHTAAERARLAAIVQSSDDAITSKTADGMIASWNPGAERLYGYTAAEAVGRPASMLVPPEHAEQERQVLERVLRGERIRQRETTRLRKDGTVVDVAMTVSPISEDTIVGASTIARDVTEQRRAAEALRRARADAERANRAKSEFLSRMNHELRTPMNAVLGFGQLLELGELGREERESVRQILSAGNHLLGLINEVLDVARIEAGKLSLSVEPVDVREALTQAVELIVPIAAARGIVVGVEPAAELSVLADQQRLKQVLLNLLSNAVKYNRESGRIDVRVRCVPNDRVRIGISDTGYGLAPEQREKLFQPFERLGADAGSIEGTGLGLTLSLGLVEAMGGSIEVESSLGEGSTFWIDLAKAETADARSDRLDEQVALAASKEEQYGGAVLYVEDNLSNLRLVERVLARFPDVGLLVAMQGTLGLELARKHGPDLILLDLHLPDTDGEQVLARLRAEPETAEIPVIVLSADVTPKRVERLRAAGVDDYLSKPFDVARLLELLREHLPERERAAEGATRAGR
ncbi:MAG: PAS domain S-box protein, partial [Actinobacteria bacterium]|nr:PAS domain S-box protein [Actinomycetota bacterium]